MLLQCGPNAAAEARALKLKLMVQGSQWPSENLMMCMCSAISNLSWCIILTYKMGGQEQEAMGWERDHAILANLLFPYFYFPYVVNQLS